MNDQGAQELELFALKEAEKLLLAMVAHQAQGRNYARVLVAAALTRFFRGGYSQSEGELLAVAAREAAGYSNLSN